MNLTQVRVAAAALLMFGTSAAAELPTPAMASGASQADAFLFQAGAGDIYEITSSVLAVQNASDPQVKAFATMLIADHTNATNGALATAKSAGVMAPPPELSAAQKDMVGQLIGAGKGPAFDRLFLDQQVAAHQQALALQSGYAASGDVPALRSVAAGMVPVIRAHLASVQQLQRRMR